MRSRRSLFASVLLMTEGFLRWWWDEKMMEDGARRSKESSRLLPGTTGRRVKALGLKSQTSLPRLLGRACWSNHSCKSTCEHTSDWTLDESCSEWRASACTIQCMQLDAYIQDADASIRASAITTNLNEEKSSWVNVSRERETLLFRSSHRR